MPTTAKHLQRALDKLQPLVPKRVARWRQLLPVVDDETRSLLERQILTVAHRTFGNLDRALLLSLPPPKRIQGRFHLGTIVYGKPRWPCGLRSEELLQNLAIFGRSGAGKTNVAFHLMAQLARARVPFLFLDWKKTARHLLPHLPRRIQVYTPGSSLRPFIFNPLIPPPGTERQVYLNHLVDVLAAAYTMGEGAKDVLQRALITAYRQPTPPTLRGVLTILEGLEVKGRAHGWKATATRALRSAALTDSPAAATDQRTLVHALLQQSTILELEGLSQAAKAFLVPLLLLWIYHVQLIAGRREQLQLVVFVEEAHHVFYESQRHRETLMHTLLRQCREVGIAMVIIDQHPHLISPVVLGNTYTSICLNQKDPRDVNKAAALSLLDEDEKPWLSRLPVGQGVVKLQDRWPQPFLVSFPLLHFQKGAVSDAWLREYLDEKRSLSAPKPPQTLESDPEERSRAADTPLSEEALRFVEDVLCHPDDGVDKRYRRLGFSADKGNRLKQHLLLAGVLQDQEVPIGRTRRLLLRITVGARHRLGLTEDTAGRGSLAHEYWKRMFAERYRQRGYRVTLEAPRRSGGTVDVLARKRAESVAIEIETGNSNVVSNVRKDLLAGFGRVLVVATDRQAFRRVRRQLFEAGLLLPPRVGVILQHCTG